MVNDLKKKSEARERILKKAQELFYRQGYQATGINQVIEEAQVAKATFYAHFPSKDDLCMAYLKKMKEEEASQYEGGLAKLKDPLKRFMYLIESMEPWLKSTQMKGCSFLNMMAEVPDPASPLRKEGKEMYSYFEKWIARLTRELKASSPKAYGHLEPAQTAKDYVAILAGAVALAELYHELEPIRHGIRMVKALTEKK